MGPSEGRATIDGALHVDGADTHWVGLEIMSSDPLRITPNAGSTPAGIPRAFHEISINAARVSLLGLLIHDLGNALFAGTLAEDLVIEGCIVYNNGWQGPDRGHGHGFYLQNRAPSQKRITANVLFHQFSSGIKVSGTGNAWLENMSVENNITFDNGLPVFRTFGLTANIFHQGGRDRSAQLRFVGNFMIHSDDSDYSFAINTGTLPPGRDLEVVNNVVQGRTSIGPWRSAVVRGNVFAMPFTEAARGRHMVENRAPDNSSSFITEWNRNTYVVRSRLSWPLAGFVSGTWRDLPFADWVSLLGFDRQGAQLLVSESPDVVRVIPVPRLPGRGFVAHWSTRPVGAFVADIRSIVRPGQRFEVRHVFALDGPPVASGIFNGQMVSLSAVSPQPADPIGLPLDRSISRRPPAVYVVTAR